MCVSRAALALSRVPLTNEFFNSQHTDEYLKNACGMTPYPNPIVCGAVHKVNDSFAWIDITYQYDTLPSQITVAKDQWYRIRKAVVEESDLYDTLYIAIKSAYKSEIPYKGGHFLPKQDRDLLPSSRTYWHTYSDSDSLVQGRRGVRACNPPPNLVFQT